MSDLSSASHSETDRSSDAGGFSGIECIAVVGAGTMGRGIAEVAVRAGKQVRLVDAEAEIARSAAEEIGRRLREDEDGEPAEDVGAGEAKPTSSGSTPDRLTVGTDLEATVRSADLVVEAVPERADLKGRILSEADAVAPEGALIASNTSSISITRLAGRTERPDRVLGLHFFNPVPAMEGVELVRGVRTSDRTLRVAEALVEELGKSPVRVNDSPGFVSNRVLMPMINEAIFSVMEGVAEPKDVDAIMKLGARHPMGPLELADLIGLDVCLEVMEVLHREIGEDKYRPCPLLRRMVDSGRLGRKTGRGFYTYSEDEGTS